ncbi:hypothetical protein BC938DRAFT_477737 [Jimgerdemannia flammicorona]|uniref:Fatty acid desaturase domain-containing protein n=1 Tax=Jimgerdemannia flammicorona TaxID=994334 RepID=A0A433P7Z4_9FUNG|nr:hypothetical protein BC938DRAFT_477737 [Jimgerdemannia flammicorona]
MWSEYSSADFYEDFAPDTDPLGKFLAKFVHTHQSWYYYPVLSLSRLSWAQQSLLFSFSKGSLNKSTFVTVTERVVLLIHWIWYSYITFAFISNSFVNQFLFFVVSQAACGYFLAIVFVLNHSGMPIITEEKAMEMDFFTVQVVTGRDVYPNILTSWFMGALNFQIEHHVRIAYCSCMAGEGLGEGGGGMFCVDFGAHATYKLVIAIHPQCFPTLPRHNLPKVQPLVQSLCKKHNVSYHMTSAYQGTKEVWKTLTTVEQVSQKLSKKEL